MTHSTSIEILVYLFFFLQENTLKHLLFLFIFIFLSEEFA